MLVKADRRGARLLCCCALLVLTSNCTAKIIGDEHASEPRTDSSPAVPVAPSSNDAPAACAPGDAGPGETLLRRLSNWEYDNSVAALLGVGAGSSAQYGLVPDAQVLGFDNNAEVVAMSMPVFERFSAAAAGIANTVTSDPVRLGAVLGCDATDPACVDGFVQTFGARAFRRQLDADEVGSLRMLAATAATSAESVARVIEGVLTSPSFLFRPELGRAEPDSSGLAALTGEEVATRLAFLLWGTTPTVELSSRARAGELDTPEGVDSAAQAMLNEPQARDGLAHFYRQWLRADVPKTLLRDTRVFPDWSPELAASMAEETARLLGHFTWSTGANLLDLFNAKFTFLDGRLAAFYGVPAPVTDWESVGLPASSQRGGLLSTAGFLAVTSKQERPSPILRGKFVREVLMCSQVPPPPADVPLLAAPVPGESERARLERHARDPACAGCHDLTDPIGFGLSGFDAIGKRRSVDELGQPVDEHGRIAGQQPQDFEGAIALGDALRARPEIGDCVVTQLLRYGLGRVESGAVSDTCTHRELAKKFSESGYNLPLLVRAFVQSNSFRKRLVSAAPPAP